MKLTISEFFKLQEDGKILESNERICKKVKETWYYASRQSNFQELNAEYYPLYLQTIELADWQILPPETAVPQLPEKLIEDKEELYKNDLSPLEDLTNTNKAVNRILDYLKAQRKE